MVYLVLMALIDLGRMKVYAATRWLWLVLSGGLFVTAPLGCESQDSGKDVLGDVSQVLYGPPPADVSEDPGPAADLPQMMYGPV